MKGFKIVSEHHFHNGFLYKEGLNIDTKPFQPKGSCVPGGLYFFTDIKDVPIWLNYGVYLYEVEVPKGRRFVKDSKGGKYRAKHLILKNRFDLRETSTWEYLLQQGIEINTSTFIWALSKGSADLVRLFMHDTVDIHAVDDYALRWAAEKGHLDIVQFLVESGADIHSCDDKALRWASEYGHLEIVKYLVENGADIHADKYAALRWSAYNGHLDVVKYLFENGADIHAEDDYALRVSAFYGHSDVVEYLKSVGAKYEGI